MLTTVKLYGHLAERFGVEFEFYLDTVGESIRALSANLPGFKAYLIEHSEPGYRVLIDDKPVMAIEELGLCMGKAKTISIVPVVAGAADNEGKGIGQIILGVVLIVASYWFPALFPVGLSMLMGGISTLLTSVPGADEDGKRSNNKYFNNGQDTIVQGLRVPLAYGRIICTGLPISVRLVVEDE